MPFTAEPISLSPQERAELEEMTKSRTLPAGDVFRARLILLLAEGLPYRTIQERLGTTPPTIARWRSRFLKQRVAGLLEIRHPGQKPSVITPSLQARVLAATRREPSDGSTHWSCRKLAKHLNISKDAVQRIWRQAGLKPHRLERYMASDDPDFERKAADIIGLYLQPPQHAAVFCRSSWIKINNPCVIAHKRGGPRSHHRAAHRLQKYTRTASACRMDSISMGAHAVEHRNISS
jgi:transposase